MPIRFFVGDSVKSPDGCGIITHVSADVLTDGTTSEGTVKYRVRHDAPVDKQQWYRDAELLGQGAGYEGS